MLALAGTPLNACGARSWLPVDQGDGDAAACVGTDVPIEPNVPNLYFVLDVSGSMLENDKWMNVRSAVSTVVRDLAANAKFGVTVFPAPAIDECAAGVEVMPLRLGDTTGDTQNAFLAATMLIPHGGTPTSATFEALVPKFRNFPGITFAILATDGGPNCDSSLPPCSIEQCTTNIDSASTMCAPDGTKNCCDGNVAGCLDANTTAQAVADLRGVGVPTYVMGIPGSAPYTAVLDQLAAAGGTARASEPLYYQVDSPDTAALTSAFNQIAANAMKSCTLILGHTPADASKVNISIEDMVVPSDGPNGWALHGQTLTVAGATCGAIQASAAPAVHVLEGCPTVR
jgi:hypothetical protein